MSDKYLVAKVSEFSDEELPNYINRVNINPEHFAVYSEVWDIVTIYDICENEEIANDLADFLEKRDAKSE